MRVAAVGFQLVQFVAVDCDIGDGEQPHGRRASAAWRWMKTRDDGVVADRISFGQVVRATVVTPQSFARFDALHVD